MKAAEPDPVKLFIGVLYSDAALLEKALQILQNKYDEIDYRSPSFPFNKTDYYVPEMGLPIVRIFISFQPLISPKEIAQIKIETNKIEKTLSIGRKRKVNLDPGYMDYDKVVLASAKYNGQKIYLDHGMWADLTLHYERKAFHPYPWSFPDFKSGLYNDVFMEIRRRYRIQRRDFF